MIPSFRKQWKTSKRKRGTLLRMQCTSFWEILRTLTTKTLYLQRMLAAYKAQGCNISLKVHFLQSHIEYFPENLRAYSEEQGERFHQDVHDFERRYQGKQDVNILAVYCWVLNRETKDGNRKRVMRSIIEKRRSSTR